MSRGTPKLGPLQRREVALAALVDERTLARALRGDPVRPSVHGVDAPLNSSPLCFIAVVASGAPCAGPIASPKAFPCRSPSSFMSWTSCAALR